MYGWTSFYGGGSFLGVDAVLAIGDPAAAFFTGQTGSLDFNSTNSPDFTALMDVFTDGQPKEINYGEFLLLNGSTLVPPILGSVSSGPEAYNASLHGAHVDFVRLVVQSVNESFITNGPDWPLSVVLLADVKWQFWGECAAGNSSCPGVDSEVVPLLAALPLFAAGLSAMGLLGWRRRKAAVAV